MHQYVLGLGSNLGDRLAYLEAAAGLVAERVGQVLARAPIYETAPIGAADQAFLNTALLCESPLAPEDALAELLAIEANLGRVRKERWGNRVIDLDILLWRDSATGKVAGFSSPKLDVPHPYLLERDFALVPAAKVAPGWVHPGTGLALEEEVLARDYQLAPPSR